MTELFGNLGSGLERNEINEKVGELNDRIAEIETEISKLYLDLEGGIITLEEFTRRHEPLDQRLSIAVYNREGYLTRL